MSVGKLMRGTLSFYYNIMYRSAFFLLTWYGAFPIFYDNKKKSFAKSKSGLLIALIHIIIIVMEVHKHLTMLFFGVIKKTSAVSAIVLSTNGLGLLILLLRRIVLVSDTVRCYNSLSEWPLNTLLPKPLKLILFVSTVAVLIEFVGVNIERKMNDKPINLDGLTTYASLGFEMQLIHTFHIIGQLYSDLNDYVEYSLIDDLKRIYQARQRNLVLYTFCKKFNSHYSMDLIIHLSCYQLYILLVLFEFVKSLASSIETENFLSSFMDLKNVIGLIRMARLFMVFIYLIESSSYLHQKSVFTFHYILRSRVNYLGHQTKEQLYLFLNELNATEVTITANHCYDINKKFLYSVSGSIVAYLVLVVSFLYDRF